MTKEQRCELAIQLGYIYNQETGKVFNRFGKEITAKKVNYFRINLRNKNLFVHHFAWYFINKKFTNNKVIDHINKNKLDNRIENLREVTKQQNQFNRKNTKGYSYDKKYNKWSSKIVINKQTIHLYYGDSEQEAKQIYLDAKNKYHKYD